MRSGPFPTLPQDPSALVTLAATGIYGANGSFPLNAAEFPLPEALMFDQEYAHSTIIWILIIVGQGKC